MNGEMNGERRTRRTESLQCLTVRHLRCTTGNAGQYKALHHFRHRQFPLQSGGCSGKGGHAGRDGIIETQPLQTANLFTHGAPDGKVAGMQPRHILAGLCCSHKLRLDLVKRKRCRIDNACTRRTIIDEGLRNQ
ncbi:hypothetical protein D3C78_986850 [compost metagenome]